MHTIIRNEMKQSHNYDAKKQTSYLHVHERKRQ